MLSNCRPWQFYGHFTVMNKMLTKMRFKIFFSCFFFSFLFFVVGNDGDGFGLLTKHNAQCPKIYRVFTNEGAKLFAYISG